ncbi:MAG TPA: ATP-dependent DNA helicase [Mycobacteriales bacterium]|nr:ATP-dependent DNA helicase [Mycobacteriales bacterium]
MSAAPYVLVRSPVDPVAAPRLDDAQQAVVDHPGGPLRVLAGPGTGKTTTLVEAVVERVRRDAAPDDVLVLTFSRKAADELRERIAARLGRTTAEPAAATFHSWCYSLLRLHTPAGRPPRLLSQPERDVRIRELLRGHAAGEADPGWPATLRPALLTRGFAREVAALFDRARERGLDGVGLRQLGEQHDRPAWVAAGRFLDEYLAVLDLRGELDYAGLIAGATGLLSDPAVAEPLRGRYAAVFVDEYQDTDPSQERLLQALAGGGRDLVVVGDPDQSIYAFRGADVNNIIDFPNRFRTAAGIEAPTLALRVCRRTGRPLLDASRLLADRLTTPGLPAGDRVAHRDLEAAGPDCGPPEIRIHPSVGDQVAGIADLLRRAHLEDGVPWQQMAVLVRSGVRSLPVLRRALVAAGVPVSATIDDLPVAQDPAVAPLLLALRLAATDLSAMSEDAARVLLTSPLGRARPTQLRVLGRKLREAQRAAGAAVPSSSAALIRAAVLDPAEVALLDDWLARPVRRLHDLLRQVHELLHRPDRVTPEEALWVLWHDSGWDRRLMEAAAGSGSLARTADRDLDAAVALFGAAARLEEREPRADVATLLDELGMQEIPGAPLEERPGSPDAVRLLTAHRSKGLEWDLVVVADLIDDVWPDLRRRTSLLEADRVDHDGLRLAPDTQSLLVDERRLLYVAMTRARRRLVLTSVAAVDDAGERPSRFLTELVTALPSVQLAGTDLLSPGSLVARLRRAVQSEESSPGLRRAAAERLARLVAATDDAGEPLVPVAAPARWWGMAGWTPGVEPIRDPDQPLALSGSGVAGYDGCPLRWFLEREARAGSAASAAQGFGTVIHALAKLVADGVLPADAEELTARLSGVWQALGFEAKWQADREREEAAAALRRLVRWLADREVRGSEVGFDITVGDVRLRGSADLLEIDAEGRVRIVDFKTSRTLPTKAQVAVHPQLGVYQVALREGAFADQVGPEPVSGGAALVGLRIERKGGLPATCDQPPLDAGPPGWADELLDRTATGIRAEAFPARAGDICGSCAFHGVCPAQPAGEQVVR